MYIDLENRTIDRSESAGLLSVCATIAGRDITIHFLVHKKFRMWGREDSWYDGPLVDWGLGPLLLVCVGWSRP